MKRFVALLLALMMVLSLTACGSVPLGEEVEGTADAETVEDTPGSGEKVELYREEHSGDQIAAGAYAIYYPNGEGQLPNIEVYKYYEWSNEDLNHEQLVYQYTPTYDEQGNLVTETLIREGYDEGGNSRQTYVETNTYNPDGSYTRTVVKEATGELRETYTFDNAGRMNSWEHLSGAWYECSYDEQGHILSERAFSVDEDWPGESHIDYTYNASSNTSTGTYYFNFVTDRGDTRTMDDEITISYDGAARVTIKKGNITPEGSYSYSEDGKPLPLDDLVVGCSYDKSGMIAIAGRELSNSVSTDYSLYFFDTTNNMFELRIEGNHRGIVSFFTLSGGMQLVSTQ